MSTTIRRRVAVAGLLAAAFVLAPLGGCERPRAKAEKIVMDGSLIGVTLEQGNEIVGKPYVKHDEFNYYWDMGPGNGVIQVLVRGGKISRVDFAEQFEPRAARDNTPSNPQPQSDTPTANDADAPEEGG